MYEGEWVNGIQHGVGRIVFPDGSFKEGYFENNVYKYPLNGEGAQGQQNLMRSTQASTGFGNDKVGSLNQNPYQLNQLGRKPNHMSNHKAGSPVSTKKIEDHNISLPNINTQQSETSARKGGGTKHLWTSSSPNKHDLSASDKKSHYAGVSNFLETMHSKEGSAHNQSALISRSGNVVINDFLSRERQIAHANKAAN